MKKYCASVLLLLIAPGICFGASARYTQLVREKQRKMEQLEKCMGTNKGLQIAGVSTLGLTAVGVAGNIAEANIIKKNEKTLEKQKTTLAEKETEYNKKEDARKDAEKERDQAKTNWENANKLREFVIKDTNAINALNVTIGTQVFVSGYDPSALQAGGLKNELANALIGVIRRCKSLEKHNGIKTVSLQDEPTWGNDEGELKLDAVWTATTPTPIMECKLIECDTPTYRRDGDQCIKVESSENKNAAKDGKSDNKSGEQKSQSNKNGGNKQGGAAVVSGPKKKGSGSSDKDICENSENGGTWMGTTCNCGSEKVWNTKNKRCEGLDEEETVKDEIKKCSADTLNAIKAKDGIVEDDKCKVTTCKGNLRKTSDGLNCECPGSDYKWNETKQTCEKNTPAAPVIKNDKWTLEQIKSSSNKSDACKNHFIAGQTLSESGPAYNCCMEIVNGKASSYDGASQKCNCKNGFDWENNKCVSKYGTSAEGNFASESNTYEWHAGGFPFNEVGYTQIEGTSACLETEDNGNYTFAVKRNINSEGRENTGGNCFCRMNTPKKSAWVFVTSKWGTANCWKHCARECSTMTIGPRSGLREAFFGSI